MSSIVAQKAAVGIRGRTRRAIVVAAAVAATTLAWLAGRLAQVDYILVTPLGSHQITLVLVIAATAAAGLVGWGVRALLERYTSRVRSLWIVLSVVVLSMSVVPIFMLPAVTDTRLTLTALHCLAAAILVPGLPQTQLARH